MRNIVAVLVLAALIPGCPAPPRETDGSVPTDASRNARVVLRIGADAETLEDDVVLETIRLGIAEARARNDRGADMEPFEADVGIVDLRAAPSSITLEDAWPANYSRIALGVSSFELRLTEDGITIQVDTTRELAIDIRCDEGVPLGPGEEVVLAATLDLGEVHAALRESELPAPIDGVIRVDDASAPAVIDAVEARLRERWSVVCGGDDDDL